jgi:hypothetical protein
MGQALEKLKRQKKAEKERENWVHAEDEDWEEDDE